MVIDLSRCFGCRSCALACHAVNRIPVDAWRRVDDCGLSEKPQRQRFFLPQSCNHCDSPPCLDVCPTRATRRRPDGIVDIDPERCLGCGYCIVACPYRARTLISRNSAVETEASLPAPSAGKSAPPPVGICTKCHFCLPRLEKGLEQGLRPGIDAEATPACVVECSAKALCFGDLDDPESPVSRLLQGNRAIRLQNSLGTAPAVFYLIPDGWTGLAAGEEEV
jgi:phenylacetyl-CoA:acceptor oxidoreductase subunit 1